MAVELGCSALGALPWSAGRRAGTGQVQRKHKYRYIGSVWSSDVEGKAHLEDE